MYLATVSTVRGSERTIGFKMPAAHPPATAGGTDCIQQSGQSTETKFV